MGRRHVDVSLGSRHSFLEELSGRSGGRQPDGERAALSEDRVEMPGLWQDPGKVGPGLKKVVHAHSLLARLGAALDSY